MIRTPTGRNDEGVALLLSLLFVVLLTALVVEFAYETQVETSVVDANLNDYQALVAAKSAVSCGMSLLVADLMNIPAGQELQEQEQEQLDPDDATGYDSLDEAWALGVPYQQINNSVMQCTISDECGKLNLNALVSRRRQQPNETLIETLRYLMTARGADEGVVDAIVDWIDQDDEPQPQGAESDYYQSMSVPYSCKNGPMASVEELLMIRGITPEIYFGDPAQNMAPLSELVTVYGTRNGRVNINTANYELLQAMGEAVGIPGLGDLVEQERESGPFTSNRDITDRGLQDPRSAGQEGQNAPRPFSTSSTAFRIRGTGFSAQSRVRIEAYLSRDTQGGPEGFRILEWREQR